MADGSSSRVGPVLLLLVVLGAAAGWNYHRNASIENAAPRPYAGYSDEELDQLIAAYRGEVAQQMERYRNAPERQALEVQDGGLLEQRIGEFERVQRLSQKRQRRAYEVTEIQILVDQLAKEKLARERDRPLYKMILRRATSF